MSERHNQARDIYRKTVKYILTIYTPERKKNMEPTNEGLEDQSPFQRVIIRFHVSFRGSSWCFFPTAVKHMLLYAGYHFFKVCGQFLPTSSKLVRGDDFKGKIPNYESYP